MKLEDIKMIPMYIRYVLPFFEVCGFLFVSEMLKRMTINQEITPMDAHFWYSCIVCTIFIVCFLFVWRYRNVLSIIIQFIILFLMYASIVLDNASQYVIPH